jgi:transcriptional regulator with XRE-family HTH domain
MSDAAGGQPGVLAQRLERLFATVHPPGRKPYTIKEAAEAINEDAGRPLLSYNYLYQLRRGTKAEPGHTRLAAIARFFQVPVTYFDDSEAAAQIDEQLELAAALRDQGVRHIAFRAAGLSTASLQTILAVIENARRLEGLPAGDDQDAPGPAVPDSGRARPPAPVTNG